MPARLRGGTIVSHFTRVKTQITDVEVLKRALGDLQYTVAENTLVRGYQGKQEHAEVVVSPGGAYDIGFIKGSDGHFQVVADWWGVHKDNGLREQAFLNPVMQRYAYHTVVDQVAKQGFQVVQETVGTDSTVKLTVRRWA
jgi:hypothetical protein